MAKITLSESGFTIIPEGVHVFKVTEVDDSKYEDFGKLGVKLQTASGQSHTETFSLVKADGKLNEGALKAWSYFARVCLGNFGVTDIDTQDIVGCYIQATVKHEKYIKKNGEHAGEEGTAVRLNDYTQSSGFVGAQEVPEEFTEDEDTDDLDDFLND